MSKDQRLDLEQKTSLRLSQAQVRFARMLELNAPEMEEAVAKELDDNPALDVSEEDTPIVELTDDGSEFRETPEEMQRADFTHDEEMPSFFPTSRREPSEINYVQPDTTESLYDYLNNQISQKPLPEAVARMAHYIIGNLDTNGYLRRPLSDIVDDLAFGPGIIVDDATAQEALQAVRSLDPPGIGASGLEDSLLMQLEVLPPSETRDNAIRIINEAFDAFVKKHLHRIVSLLKISRSKASEAVALITSLNPKPGASIGSGPGECADGIIPDFIIDNSHADRGEISITLNHRIPELRIEQSFEAAVRNMESNSAQRARNARANEFIRTRFDNARDFIKLVRQRQDTLFAVMTAIVEIQKDFFTDEDPSALKPMLLKDVAARTGYDKSVISRATNNKYASTCTSTYPLRFFFSDAYGDEGAEISSRSVQEFLRRQIAAEDKKHPLSDESLREILCNAGFDVSRRTIAKYRDRLGIPVARLRKEI